MCVPKSGDTFLSFLPLSHTFERTAGYYLALATGCIIAYNRSVLLLAEDLKTIKPTVIISVPVCMNVFTLACRISFGSPVLSPRSFLTGLLKWVGAIFAARTIFQ